MAKATSIYFQKQSNDFIKRDLRKKLKFIKRDLRKKLKSDGRIDFNKITSFRVKRRFTNNAGQKVKEVEVIYN